MKEKETEREEITAVSPEELKALKAKFKKVYVITVEVDEDEKYQFLARRPSRALIESIAAEQGNISKANEAVIENMIIGGDKAALDDGIVYGAVQKELLKIVELAKSFLTKA